MNIFKLGLLLLTASGGLAYELDAACSNEPEKWGNLNRRIKVAVREARWTLSNAAAIAKGCQEKIACGTTDANAQLLAEEEQWCGKAFGDFARRVNSHNLVETLLGGESSAAWKHVEDATTAAKDTLLSSKDDDKAKIYCGDSAFIKDKGVWVDKDSGRYFSTTSPKRPCDTGVLGLAISNPDTGKKGILLCDEKGIFDKPAIDGTAGRAVYSHNNLNAASGPILIDALGHSISAELIHEMIHLGDIDRFSLKIGEVNGRPVTEKYGYDECKSLQGSDMKWKNCDTVAIIARGLYMNSFYSDENELKKLPSQVIPSLSQLNSPTQFDEE